MRIALTAAAFCLAAPLAHAGGFSGIPTCADLAASGQLAAGTQCRNAEAVVVVEADAHERGFLYRVIRQIPAYEIRHGRRCPYPHRPSDTVFSGGSAYILKADVRAAIGCDW